MHHELALPSAGAQYAKWQQTTDRHTQYVGGSAVAGWDARRALLAKPPKQPGCQLQVKSRRRPTL
jgi:hypothetical protein